MTLRAPSAVVSDNRLTTDRRLLTHQNFQFVFDHARFRIRNDMLLMLACGNARAEPRLGLVVGKKRVPKATQRNRFKRLVRESFRHRANHLSGLDIIVLARGRVDHAANSALFERLAAMWQELQRQRHNTGL